MSLFLAHARSSELYRELCRVPATGDGNLLEGTDDATAEAQIEFIRWAFQRARPDTIIEVGTHKAMFGYLLSLLSERLVLHTIDSHLGAAQAVELLNRGQSNVRCVFYPGDSREIFPSLKVTAGFAWVDGGHDTDISISDILSCYRLRVPYVAVDDSAYPSVAAAIRYTTNHTTYRPISNPFAQHDRRRAVLLSLFEGGSDS
jgi:hypothetical protein